MNGVCRAAAVGLEVLGVRQVGSREGYTGGVERHGGGLRRIGSRAVGRHIESVLRAGVETSDSVGVTCDARGDNTRGIAHRVGGSSVEVVSPSQRCAVGSYIGGGYTGDRQARRHFFEGDIVHGGIPYRGGTVGTDGHVAAVAGVVGQIGRVFSVGGTLHVDGVDVDERVDVTRVGHHTHVEDGMIGGAGGTGPEFELQVAHVVVAAHARHHDALVVTVCARSGGKIPVETAVAGVAVAGGAAHIRPTKVGCGVVQVVPAVDEGRRGAAACGGDAVGGLEAHGVGQRGDEGALGMDGDVGGVADLGGGAVSHNAVTIVGVGCETRDGVGGGGEAGGDDTVGTDDRVGGARVQRVTPGEGDAVVRDSGREVGDRLAAGDLLEGHVIEIGNPCRGGTVGADGHITAGAGVGCCVGFVLSVSGTLHVDGVHIDERADVSRVGHHTHVENGMVGGAGGFGPEFEVQSVHVVGSTHAGQDSNLIVTIGGRRATVPVEGAAAGVAVGSAAGDVGIAGIGGAVGEAVPALGGEGCVGTAARGGTLEAVGVRQGSHQVALGVGIHAHGAASLGGRAVGHDVEGVVGVGGEAGDGVGGGSDARGDSGALGIAHRVGGTAVLLVSPRESDTVVGDVGGNEIGDLNARGLNLKSDVIHIGGIGGGATVLADGHISTVASVTGEVDSVLGPIVAVHVDSVSRQEGVDVGRVAHHTHDEVTGGGGGSLGPEPQTQGVDGIGGGVDTWQDDHFIVTVGASGGVHIPVESLGTVCGVVVSGAAGNVRITHVGGTVVQVLPAFGVEHRTGGATRGGILEVVGVRQGGHQVALGMERSRQSRAAVGGRAERADGNAVVGVVQQSGEGVGGVGRGVVAHDTGVVAEGDAIGSGVGRCPYHRGVVYASRGRGLERLVAGGCVARHESHHHAGLQVGLAAAVGAAGGIGIIGVAVPDKGLVARAGRGEEVVDVSVIVVGVVVHNDHQVACATIVVGSGEGELAPTLRAVEGTGVDHDGRGAVERFDVAVAAEGRLRGGLQPDGAVGLLRHSGGVVVVVPDAVDGHGTANLGLVDNGFGEAVFIVVVHGRRVGRGG